MREFAFDDINPVEAIKQRIWDIFNVLRDENIRPEDYHIVLLLLSYYREGLISSPTLHEFQNRADLEVWVIEKIQNNEANREYLHIHFEIAPLLKHLRSEGLKRILAILGTINNTVLSENFIEIFDDVLQRINDSRGARGIDHLQPYELSRFISGISNEKSTDTVFNPFAGLASYAVTLDQGSDYTGQELNRRNWALGSLRIIASSRPGKTDYSCTNSLSTWPDDRFDLIISTPPFRMRISPDEFNIPPYIKTVEQFFLFKGLDSLNSEGRMIAVLPQGFLFSGAGDQKIRQILIESGKLEAVISLPSGIFNGTGIKTCILVIDKSKNNNGLIRFINAETFVHSSSKKKTLDDYKLGGVYVRSDESEYSWYVDVDQIRENDYNLIGDRYLFKKIDGVRIEEILEPYRGYRTQDGESGRIVRIRDLSNDPIDSVLDLSKVEEDIISRPGFKRIDSSCLLLATRWKSLKPTYFQYEGIPIFVSNDIEAFFVDSSKVNVAYLINELNSDYVREQLVGYSTSASIPFIRKADLLRIIVKLPSLDEQKGKVQGLRELSEKLKTIREERNALAHGQTLLQFNEFASLKHTLGRPRQNILDWADNLFDFFQNSVDRLEAFNREFKSYYDIDILGALMEIKKDVGYMTEILERGEKGFILENHPLTPVPLNQLNQFITGLNNNGFKFSLKKELLTSPNLSARGIDCNMTLLKVLFDNILTNANKYGFDHKSQSNLVVIELIEEGEKLLLRIRNNGKPFPKNFTKEKFVAKFTTAHPDRGTGLGGYDINRIATYFGNSDWKLHLDDKGIYPVEFEFMFNIKLIV
jgi:type I restriction enzyme M protein